MLLDFGVTPYLVFDGDNLPSKAGTNKQRGERRKESRALAMQLHKAGKTSQAQQEFQKAVDVTPHMAKQLIEELKKLDVQYVVAPYEADAQLVYLEQKGIIDGILSEDSDMLVFGAKRLLTKLNQYGELIEVERADFAICKELNLAGWTDSMFRRMAILSGCDYLPNIGKVGLKTAHGYIRKHKEVEKILRVIQFEGKLIVPDNYLDHFRNAELTFLHHRVFCPVQQRMTFLNELTPGLNEDDMSYLGPYVETEVAIGVACGDLDPFSKKPIVLDKQKLGRPVLADARRQTYSSTPNLKSGISIETFFKRQPLAELDPNSLTPSPSQQRLLERHQNTSWEPRLVSSAPGLRRTMTTQAVGPSARAFSGTDRSAFLARASAVSTYQPPKRQRLCSDSHDPSPSKEVEQSPFFCSTEEASSPLAQKTSKQKKIRRSAFAIFSDDSIDKVMNRSTIQQVASPEKELSEGYEAPPMPGSYEIETPFEIIPQSSPRAVSPAKSLSSPGHPQASSSPLLHRQEQSSRASDVREINQDDYPDEFEDLLEYHVRKQNETLLQTFVYQPEATREQAFRSLSPTNGPNTTFSAQSKQVQMTALSTLPNKASVESFCKTISLSKTFDRQSPEVQQFAFESLDKPFEPMKERGSVVSTSKNVCHGIKTKSLENGIRHESDITNDRKSTKKPAKMNQSTSATASKMIKGSEDAMIPNSEDEGSEIGSPARRPGFDLSAFAFTHA